MWLDVLRTLKKLPASAEMVQQILHQARGQNRVFDRASRQFLQRLRRPEEAQGRWLTGQLFNLLTATQMLEFASPPLADAWCRLVLDPRGETLLPERLCQLLLNRAIGAE
ncbi:Putative acyl-CoA dehydrogenase AidB [Rahnella aquatilis]|nr:Putative acyl-CoA dehydrogenase AidB [Rahnella aquatilis]